MGFMGSDNYILPISKNLHSGLREIHSEQAGLRTKTNEKLNDVLTEINARIQNVNTDLRDIGKKIVAQPKNKNFKATLIEKKRELKGLIEAQKDLVNLKNKAQKQTASTIVKLAEKAIDYLDKLGHKLGYVEGDKTRRAGYYLRADVSHVKFRVDRLKTKLAESHEEIEKDRGKNPQNALEATIHKTNDLFAKLKIDKKELKKTIESTEVVVKQLVELTAENNTLSKATIDKAVDYSEQILVLEDELTAQEAIKNDHKEKLELLSSNLKNPKITKVIKYDETNTKVIDSHGVIIIKKYQTQLEKAYRESLKNPTASRELYSSRANATIEKAEAELQAFAENLPHTNPKQQHYFKAAENELEIREPKLYENAPLYNDLRINIKKEMESKISIIKEKYEKKPADTPLKEKQLLQELNGAKDEADIKFNEIRQIQSAFNDEIFNIDELNDQAKKDKIANIQEFQEGLDRLKEDITSAYEKIMKNENFTVADPGLSNSFLIELRALKTNSFRQLFAKDIESTRAFIASMRHEANRLRQNPQSDFDLALANKMLERLSTAELDFKNAIRNIGSERLEKLINIKNIFSMNLDKAFDIQFKQHCEEEVKKELSNKKILHDLTIQETTKAIKNVKLIQERLSKMDPKEVNSALVAAGIITKPTSDDPYKSLQGRIAKQLEVWEWRVNRPFISFSSVIQPDKVQKEINDLQIEKVLKSIEDAIKKREANEANMKPANVAIGMVVPLTETMHEMHNDNLIKEKREFWEGVLRGLPLNIEEPTQEDQTSPSPNLSISSTSKLTADSSVEVSQISSQLLPVKWKPKIQELIKFAQQEQTALAPQAFYNPNANELYLFLGELQKSLQKSLKDAGKSTAIAIEKYINTRFEIGIAYAQLLDSIEDLNVQELEGLRESLTSKELINQLLSYTHHLRENGISPPAILEKAILELQFSHDIDNEIAMQIPLNERMKQPEFFSKLMRDELDEDPVSEKIVQQVKSLVTRDKNENGIPSQVVLHGGKEDHAFLYVIEPSEDGKTFSFKIINTGEGTVKDKIPKKGKSTTSDIVYTGLTLWDLRNEFFTKLLQIKRKEYNVREVLNFIDKSFLNWDKSNKVKGRTHSVQAKGTCALKCLTSWLHERLGEHYYPFKEFASKKALVNMQEGFKVVEGLPELQAKRLPEPEANNRWEYFFGVPTKEKAAQLQAKMVAASQQIIQKRAEKAAASLKTHRVIQV